MTDGSSWGISTGTTTRDVVLVLVVVVMVETPGEDTLDCMG